MEGNDMVWIQVGLWGLCLMIGIGSYIYRTYYQGYRRLQAIQEVEDEQPYMV